MFVFLQKFRLTVFVFLRVPLTTLYLFCFPAEAASEIGEEEAAEKTRRTRRRRHWKNIPAFFFFFGGGRGGGRTVVVALPLVIGSTF